MTEDRNLRFRLTCFVRLRAWPLLCGTKQRRLPAFLRLLCCGFSPAADTNTYRYLRHTLDASKVNAWCKIREIEFYDQNGVKLYGTPIGSGPSASTSTSFDKAFDGNTGTGFIGAQPNQGQIGMDFGSGNAQNIGKVKFFPQPGYTDLMAAGRFQGANGLDNSITVIGRVSTSDGRSVQYTYSTLADTEIAGINYVVLTGAQYGDGTSAVYTYAQEMSGYTPQLIEANDPRRPGAAARVRYGYLSVGVSGQWGQLLKLENGLPLRCR